MPYLRFGGAPQRLVARADNGVDVGDALALDEVTHRCVAGLSRAGEAGTGDAVTDLAPEAALLEIRDAVRPKEEHEALGHSKRWPVLAEPEEALLHRFNRIDDRHHRCLVAVITRVDQQPLGEQPEAD